MEAKSDDTLPWNYMTHEELEKNYSPSQWSVRYSADEIITEHIKFSEKATLDIMRSLYCWLNVKYGSKFNQKIDIFCEDLSQDCPILIYIHGGYWQELSKNLSWFPAASMCEYNVVTAVLGYTLAPEVTIDEIVDEVSNGIKYVCGLAKMRGSQGVFLVGWSAGAHLISQAMLKTPNDNKTIKGVVSIGGIFDLRPLVSTYVNDPLFLTRESSWELSPMKHVSNINKDLPFLFTFGEFDSPEFKRQSLQYMQLLQQNGIIATVHEIKKEDHFSLVEGLNSMDHPLTKTIIKFIKTKLQ